MYGITVEIGGGSVVSKSVTIFLHECWLEEQTFMYTGNVSLYYSFFTVEEARIWFLSWYEGRKEMKRYLPEKKYFRISEIPPAGTFPRGDNEPKSTDTSVEIV